MLPASHVLPPHAYDTQGGTYGGNAVAAAAAVATIDVIREEGVLENVKARGTQLMKGACRRLSFCLQVFLWGMFWVVLGAPLGLFLGCFWL